MKINKYCYTCGYFDTSLPPGKKCKCFTPQCPVRILGSAKVANLLREYKKRKVL